MTLWHIRIKACKAILQIRSFMNITLSLFVLFLFLFVQFTEEKLGQAEKTELDAHLENLLIRAENTKQWTERIMKQTEVLLQPNPSKTTLLFVEIIV